MNDDQRKNLIAQFKLKSVLKNKEILLNFEILSASSKDVI